MKVAKNAGGFHMLIGFKSQYDLDPHVFQPCGHEGRGSGTDTRRHSYVCRKERDDAIDDTTEHDGNPPVLQRCQWRITRWSSS